MNAAVNLLQEKFPDELLEVVEFRGETTIAVKPGRLWTSAGPCGMTRKPSSGISP